MTWSGFVKAFFGKCFLDCAGHKKVMEFMQLKQNNLAMDQYETKFFELSRFTPRLVEDKEDKVKKFPNGLRPNIQSMLAPLNLKDYNDLYECA